MAASVPAGLLAACLSAFFSSAKDLVSKRLAFRLDGTISTFASFAYALPFYLLLFGEELLRGGEVFSWTAAFWGYVLLRSLTDAFAEGMKMHAFAHGEISVVSCFFALSPLFLLITSPLITGDRLTPLGAAAVAMSVCGSLVMVYEPSHVVWRNQKKGILLALGAAVFFSLNSCFDRLAVKEGTPIFSGFAMTIASAALLFPLVAFRSDTWPALVRHNRGLLLRGLLEVAFMSGKMYAIREMQAPYVVSIMRLNLLLSILGGHIFFREKDFARRLAAGTLIVAGAFLVVWEQPLWAQLQALWEPIDSP